MKKIYFIAMLLVMGFAANAQRNLKLDFQIIRPSFDTNIVTGSTLNYQYRITNNSTTAADSLQIGDTVAFYDPSCTFNTATSKFTSYVYFVATSSIKMGSSINLTPTTPLTFAKIENLIELATLPATSYKAKPFVNNKQYAWFVLLAAVLRPSTNIAVASVTGFADTGRIWINKGITGINELSFNENTIATYPNPAINNLSFEYTFTTNENATARIMDAAGRTVLVKQFENNSGTQKFDMDVTALQSGNYFLNLLVGDKTMTSKFSVQK